MSIGLRLLGACVSVFIIFAMLYIAHLAYARPTEFNDLNDNFSRKSVFGKAWSLIVLLAAFGGCAWCFYWGFVRLFWFIPPTWGGYDEDGVWSWTGDTLAGALALIGAFGCAAVLGRLATTQINEREWLRRLYGDHSKQNYPD